MYDVLYVLRNDINESPDELIHSVRSVAQNFPFRKLIFCGGCPDSLTPDIYIAHKQIGTTKWERAGSSLKKALSDDRLTDYIWLFNDDFYVLNKLQPGFSTNYSSGTLEKRIREMRGRFPNSSQYIRNLETMRTALIRLNKDTLSFALHMPMLINRRDFLQMLEEHPQSIKYFRSFYGNLYKIPCEFVEKDCKIYTNDELPDTFQYLSTTDGSYKEGKVGEFIRQYFPTPSRYETAYKNAIDCREQFTEEGDIRYDFTG